MLLKINHFGFVVKSIDEYVEHSKCELSSKVIFDPIQNSNLCLLKTTHKGMSIELIEPLNKKSTTHNFLKKNGNSFHHICYEIDDEASFNDYIKIHNLKRILGPVPAVLFDNKHVVFTYSKVQGIVEFLFNKGYNG